MDETFIQYIWKHQQFDHRNLKVTDGREISILSPGIQNADSGPDFTGARLRMDGMIWSGNIEIHIMSKDWYRHQHHLDPAYNNVILHVVWQNKGATAVREDGTEIPVLELRSLIPEGLLLNYDKLVGDHHVIPCRAHLEYIDHVYVYSMLDKVLADRLERKSNRVRKELERTEYDWEESTYRILTENFGFKKNAELMKRLARHLPLKILKKYSDRPEQIEALLFGTAGLLSGNPTDAYHEFLQREYSFLKEKFKLPDAGLGREVWKFSRLRPPNFPTIRLSQLAQMISRVPGLFSDLIRENDLRSFLRHVRIKQSPYWVAHFDFGKKAKKTMPGLGVESLENIVVNTFVPVLTAYGKIRDEQQYIDRALQYLQIIKPERNRILSVWQSAGIMPKNAFDSQALIELYNEYCMKRKCAACNIGLVIIGKPKEG